MKTALLKKGCILWIVCVAMTISVVAEDMIPIKLPAPQIDGGKPLMQVLNARHSTREFAPTELPPQILSNLLWAGFGINRPYSGKRTAPSARNWQEISIYIATAKGVYLYDAAKNELLTILSKDIRSETGTQPFVATAPVNLIYAADFSKMSGGDEASKLLYAGADTGFISENIYLFCSSEGLATVVRGSVDKENLQKTLQLSSDQKIILTQTIGYPK